MAVMQVSALLRVWLFTPLSLPQSSQFNRQSSRRPHWNSVCCVPGRFAYAQLLQGASILKCLSAWDTDHEFAVKKDQLHQKRTDGVAGGTASFPRVFRAVGVKFQSSELFTVTTLDPKQALQEEQKRLHKRGWNLGIRRSSEHQWG